MSTDATTANSNFAILRECMSAPIILRAAPPDASSGGAGKKRTKHKPVSDPISVGNGDDAEELAEFIDYLSTELFSSLPPPLQTMSHSSPASLPTPNFPPTLLDTLESYSLVGSASSGTTLLQSILDEYVAAAQAPPPVWSHTRATECEICERDVPLTYHHLIPREVHKKVIKRGWHNEDMLGSVAWLCRPCHSMVHRIATNEELARSFHTVELLVEREDVKKWATWVGRQKWGVRRG